MEDVEGKGFSSFCGATFSFVGITGRTSEVLPMVEGMAKYLNRVEYSLESDKTLPTDAEMTRNGGGEQEPHPAFMEEFGQTMKTCNMTAYRGIRVTKRVGVGVSLWDSSLRVFAGRIFESWGKTRQPLDTREEIRMDSLPP